MNSGPNSGSTNPNTSEQSPSHGRGIRTTVDTVVAAGQLLSSPRKCKVWHEVWLADGLTTNELTAATNIPQSSLYDLTREMVKEGSLYTSGTADNNAAILRAADMQVFVSDHPEGMGPQYNIHSTLIGVLGTRVDSLDVETFLERNNYTMLLESITAVLTILHEDHKRDQKTAHGPDEGVRLEDYLDWLRPPDARLIEGHIAGVLQREAAKPTIDWEFPTHPSIDPLPSHPAETPAE